MIKKRQRHTFILVLITAFFTMQWSNAHIHLAAHHDHDGSHHAHTIETHAHFSDNHHRDAIDIGAADTHHDVSEHNVVELDPDSHTPANKKLSKYLSTVLLHDVRWTPVSKIVHTPSWKAHTHLSSYHTYSTVLLRAPPRLS